MYVLEAKIIRNEICADDTCVQYRSPRYSSIRNVVLSNVGCEKTHLASLHCAVGAFEDMNLVWIDYRTHSSCRIELDCCDQTMACLPELPKSPECVLRVPNRIRWATAYKSYERAWSEPCVSGRQL